MNENGGTGRRLRKTSPEGGAVGRTNERAFLLHPIRRNDACERADEFLQGEEKKRHSAHMETRRKAEQAPCPCLTCTSRTPKRQRRVQQDESHRERRRGTATEGQRPALDTIFGSMPDVENVSVRPHREAAEDVRSFPWSSALILHEHPSNRVSFRSPPMDADDRAPDRRFNRSTGGARAQTRRARELRATCRTADCATAPCSEHRGACGAR